MLDRTSLASILLALAVAAGPAYADSRTLTVAVGEGLDAHAVRARLAAELRTTVVPTRRGGVCDLPCLSVTLDGDQAVVAFTPVWGAPRARTVTLGDDPAQWPIVITLLAGNVVRDEAADVLALLPEAERAPEELAGPIEPVDLGGAAPPGPPIVVVVPPPAAPPAPPPRVAAVTPPGLTAEAEAARRRADRTFDGPWTFLGFGFCPGLSTDFTRVGRVKHFLSLDLLAGVSGGSTGVTISGIADVERGPVSGFQAGGVASLAARVSGVQVGGVASVTGDLSGIQVGGVAVAARRVDGIQIGGVAAFAAGRADVQLGGVAVASRGRASTQIAGVAAAADGAARLQLAGVATVAKGDTNIQAAGVAAVANSANVQASGVANVAYGTANIQVAGVVNVARRVEGLQIGVVNVARRVEGVQVGVVNVGSADGNSFGLINIVPGGRADLEASVDSSGTGAVLFRHGGRHWHNVYGVAGEPKQASTGRRDDVWMYGLGFGPSWRTGSAVFDLELVAWQTNHGARHYDGLSILGQLRLTAAYGLGPFKLVVGGALNTLITSDDASPLVTERRTTMDTDPDNVSVLTWPTAFAGIRL